MQIRIHTVILASLVILGLIFISPFAITLLLAAITAYVMHPLVHRLDKKFGSYHIGLLVSILIVLLPLAIFFIYVATDITPFLRDFKAFSGEINALLDIVRVYLSSYGLEKYATSLQSSLAHVTDYLAVEVEQFVRSIPRLLLNTAIYIFATYQFIKDGKGMVNYVREFADRLESEEKRLIGSIMRGLEKSFDVLFISYIAMAIITSALGWIGYYLLGVPYAAFLGLLSGLFAFLPVLGVWMTYIPAAVYMYSIGNQTSAIMVVLFGFFVLTISTDFIIRPMLGTMKTGVSPFTIFLGFFAGPALLGAPGFIIGPIVFVLVETVLKEYIDFIIHSKKPERPKKSYRFGETTN